MKCVLWIIKALLSLRYKISLTSIPSHPTSQGILFLPNHPAEIDPIILEVLLWPTFCPRPLVAERFFYLTGARYFMKKIGALPVPEGPGVLNKWQQKKVDHLLSEVVHGLQRGENFLIYPSGKLKLSAEEEIGGASFVPHLLAQCPQATVMLIRTTGLWGSRFSRALTGVAPSFWKVLGDGVKGVLKSAIFFSPRRKIEIEIEEAPADFPRTGGRMEINPFLERWYNQKGPEPLTLVPSCFWQRRVSLVGEEIKSSITGLTPYIPLTGKEESEQAEIYAFLEKLSEKERTTLHPSMHLNKEVGLDSLDLAQLYTFLRARYDLEELPSDSLQTVEDVLRVVRTHIPSPPSIEEKGGGESVWIAGEKRPLPNPPYGKTIQEAFLRSCDRMGGSTACAGPDGKMSYRRLKRAALLLARRLREMEGDQIGILLPSSPTTYLLIFATLLAKKIPVMLNWTVGVRALDHSVQSASLKVVLSSRRFLTTLQDGDLGLVDEKLFLLEDLASLITWREKITAFLKGFYSAPALLKNLHLEGVQESDPAVFLFTSGTESLPKGVPLSHRNLLSNQTAALACVTLGAEDVFYGVLPPFHSFGFSLTGLLPILTGVRAYYAPDPTHSRSIARDLEKSRTTFFCCAPTFICGVLRVASPQQLRFLRTLVSGGEKAPQELYDKVGKLGGKVELLEGYGITECGPVVTLCRPGKKNCGVGEPIPGVSLSISPEGEILIQSPGVFSGYLGKALRSPFWTYEGKSWYRSGDLGSLTPEGSLILSGRSKRFVKMGGEMVSLGGVEEEILSIAQQEGWCTPEGPPPLAVGAHQKEGEKPKIVLFATFKIDKQRVNELLFTRGYGRLTKISEVIELKSIPLTGMGKICYRDLDDKIV